MNIRTGIRAAGIAFIVFVSGLTAAQGGMPTDAQASVYPDAERIGAVTGTPPAAPAFVKGRQVGYVLSTADVIGSTGYGGETIDVLIGVTNAGKITGAALRKHNEPILVIGISDRDLQNFVRGFAGLNVLLPAAEQFHLGSAVPDIISGATISSTVIQDAVVRAARAVLRARTATQNGPTLKREAFANARWDSLIADASIQRRRLTVADAAERIDIGGDPNGLFIELYAALLTPARIGGNLLGVRNHQQLFSTLGPDDNAVLIAADGYYSFKGRAYRKSGVFDRIQIVQGSNTIPLYRDMYENIDHLKADGSPQLREIARFVLANDTGFDPAQPWRLDLYVRDVASGSAGVFSLDYRLPDMYIAAAAPVVADLPAADAAAPLWHQLWDARRWQIAGVLSLLVVLTGVLVFQDQLVRYRRFRDLGRLAFLSVVLVWLGWYAGGQLSVLQVLTFAHALLGEFRWEHFLVDPMIFILWGYVAVTLLFWGRGVYCGWLCPFGALQELMNAAARRIGVPQIKVPFAVHERLWAIKYIIFLGLFAASLHTIREATLLAEVEPFKTAITMTFLRSWPFVLYVAALLVAGLFIERFFCRYLCPLGAALAIPARLRMFNWLRRRRQCGSECQICSERCTVQAIHPTGEINPNECIHCLECQTYYVDDHVCPPLVVQRKKLERRHALAAGKDISAEVSQHD